MGVLLRLTKQTIWSGDAPDAARREGAVLTFRRREEDTDGISVFEVADDAERELVVAAIACGRVNEKPVDLPVLVGSATSPTPTTRTWARTSGAT